MTILGVDLEKSNARGETVLVPVESGADPFLILEPAAPIPVGYVGVIIRKGA